VRRSSTSGQAPLPLAAVSSARHRESAFEIITVLSCVLSIVSSSAPDGIEFDLKMNATMSM
jgi:hypothetical protein